MIIAPKNDPKITTIIRSTSHQSPFFADSSLISNLAAIHDLNARSMFNSKRYCLRRCSMRAVAHKITEPRATPSIQTTPAILDDIVLPLGRQHHFGFTSSVPNFPLSVLEPVQARPAISIVKYWQSGSLPIWKTALPTPKVSSKNGAVWPLQEILSRRSLVCDSGSIS